MKNIKKLLFLLSPSEIRRALFLLLMMLVMALIDMIGVASILPFISVLTNPDLVETNLILNSMFKTSKIFGVENSKDFLFMLGIIVFLLLVISLVFKALTTYVQLRFVQMREYTIGKRLIEEYLHQPYSWFLNRHSADLGKTILAEVGQITSGYLKPLLNLIARGMVAFTLIALLVLTEPKVALVIGLTLSIVYFIIFYFLRRYLGKIGKQRLKNNQLRYISISEAFGAAKEIKTGGLEKNYIQRFSIPAKTYAQDTASARVISQLPHFFLEAIAFGGIMLMILYLMLQKGSFNSALPIITLYVFAGYRLMPAMQQIYASFTSLAFVSPSLDKLYKDVKNLKPLTTNKNQSLITLNQKITLKNIHYKYPNASLTSLNDINLTIQAKSIIGIIGKTGSGKTTLVDIILGLLEPQKGLLKIDEKIITLQNLRAWQQTIGYVPQHIFLSDDSIAANIAFGIDLKDINHKSIERASKIANLHNFVNEELPNKYQTTIGERGIRLSGGQRQRIGIARALYHSPQVLILDEATSALDNNTEKAVMEAVNKLNKEITVIIIAHRLNTVKSCDKIYLLEKGKLKSQGTFDELIKIDENLHLDAKN